ncbi:MAG: histidine kinase [Candidatus Dormibacteraeota bacterium]|nr:histidine kinase [Candidatus Dormibacteraeota bacterium]
MDLNNYVEALQSQLATAALAGGEQAIQVAERLTAPLDAAARLVLQDALADAAQEITRELAPGSVELRLRGRALTFVVTPSPAFDSGDERPDADAPVAAVRGSEPAGDGGTSRISFRPPDRLKARIEDAAEREGLSVNAFLVKTLASALDPGRAPSSGTDRKGGTRVDGWFR